MDTVNVLILYGGDRATAPRDMLLEWLNSKELHDEIGKTVVAKKVAAMIAHNEGSIDQRVEEMMDWANKAIFLLTPDKRSEFGAPNVLEEFGRWIGQKSRRTMLTLRHEKVKVHSNASGLVYVGFEKDLDIMIKCRNRIVAFINEVVPPEANAGEPEAAKAITDNSIHAGDNATIGDGNTNNNTDNKANRDIYTGPVTINNNYSSESGPNNFSTSNPTNATSASPNQSGETMTITLPKLREFLSDKYNKEEIRWAIKQIDTKIEIEDFGTSKMGMILDLLAYLDRRDMLEDLLGVLSKDPRLKKAFGAASKYVIS
ncbi:MAG: TIR domain-containing protein [Anaerolineae bacterium]